MKKNILSLEDIKDDLVIIRINQLYREKMTAHELYEATRGIWKVKLKNVVDAKYALAYSEGDIVEVFKIDEWLPAGSIKMKTRSFGEQRLYRRLEFIGVIADDDVRSYYLGRNAKGLFAYGECTPLKMFYCKR